MKYKVERTVGVFALRVATNFGRARGSNVCITLRTSHIRIANTDMNHPEKEIDIDYVKLENRFDDIIPDIVVDSGDEHFFIEIYVTHPIDDEKLKKLKEKKISTIEIDLGRI